MLFAIFRVVFFGALAVGLIAAVLAAARPEDRRVLFAVAAVAFIVAGLLGLASIGVVFLTIGLVFAVLASLSR